MLVHFLFRKVFHDNNNNNNNNIFISYIKYTCYVFSQYVNFCFVGFVKLPIYFFACSLYRAPFTPCVSIHFLLRTPFTCQNAFADELVRGLSNTIKKV